jgi:dTDP-4-dehydrorhamnose reductase
MKVLVTGAGGQLAHDVVRAFAEEDVVSASHAVLDTTDRSAVQDAVSAARPDAIIHCAAWTAVDACESDPDRAFAVNALSVRHVADAAESVGAHLCHISTDYVFDGLKMSPYTEQDTPAPLSVYGASKLAGEREAGPEATVVRTSWVCGLNGANMVKTILRLCAQDENLAFVDDQRGCPTFTEDLAAMIRTLTTLRVPGLVHVTNQGPVSWFEFAREVLAEAGDDPDRVRPIRTAELRPARPAPRPANSVLDNAALRSAGFPLLDDFRVPLARLVRQLLAEG